MKTLTRIAALLGAFAFVAGTIGDGYAQAYPNRSIRVIIPFSPGGSTDTITRPLAQKLTTSLGQSVVIDNRPGAGGNIGMDQVAKASPDGYTLLMAAGSIAINPSLYKKMPFDVVKDLDPIILVCVVTQLTVVHPSLPVKSVKELIALAKSRPGELNFASAGTGTSTHLAGELFKTMAKIDMVHIPCKGSGAAMPALLGGQVSLMFANMPGTIQHVQGGRLRLLAVNTEKRSPLLPNVPTVSESGIRGFESSTFFGLLAPAGTPKEIIARMNSELDKALKAADTQERMAAEGAVPMGGSPEQFASYLKAQIEKWGKVVRDSGARVE